MRQRAQEMGAELAIASGPSGTIVRIRVPFGVVGAA
jgi:signal transduction histidine kinase